MFLMFIMVDKLISKSDQVKQDEEVEAKSVKDVTVPQLLVEVMG